MCIRDFADRFNVVHLFIGFSILVGLAFGSVTETAGRSYLQPELFRPPDIVRLSQDEKASRTAAQKKIDSQLLYAIKQKRGETEGVPTEPIVLEFDQKGRTLVDITTNVTPQVESQIRKLGGVIVSSDERYHTMRAKLALEKLAALAALQDVRFIAPAAMPGFNRVTPN